MPPVVINLRNAPDKRDVIHRAVEAFSNGKIVALPTETVYGIAASALNSTAVERLGKIKGRPAGKPFAFAIKSFQDAMDYVPDLSDLARRLARRCWPGPITLVLDNTHPDSVVNRLPDYVRKTTVPNQTIGLRVPAHETTLQILRLLAGPIVLTSANLSNNEDCVEASQIIDQLGDDVDLIVDDGRSRYGQPSTIVKVGKTDYNILRQGVFDETTLKRMSGFIALVVCTGNTCRSPMGEALLKKHIAARLNVGIEELENRGVTVMSAGIAAMAGGRAADQAVEVMNEMSLDIGDHASQPVTDRLIRLADVVLTMTDGHRRALLQNWPEAAPRTYVVRKDGTDVSDPVGMPVDVYRSTAEQISEHLKQWADEFDFSDLGSSD